MKKFQMTILSVLLSMNTWAAEGHDWGYQNENAPDQWATLNQNYHACLGHNQSPINIEKTVNGRKKILNSSLWKTLLVNI